MSKRKVSTPKELLGTVDHLNVAGRVAAKGRHSDAAHVRPAVVAALEGVALRAPTATDWLGLINQAGASAFAEPSPSSTDGAGASVRRTEIELSPRGRTLKHGLGSGVLDKLVASGFLSDEPLEVHGTLRIVTRSVRHGRWPCVLRDCCLGDVHLNGDQSTRATQNLTAGLSPSDQAVTVPLGHLAAPPRWW
jgi:hypothetical protein